MNKLKEAPQALVDIGKSSKVLQNLSAKDTNNVKAKPLVEMLEGSLASKNHGLNFISTIKHAIDNDPVIIARRRDVEAKQAAIGVNEARKEFQVGTTLYGGIEDVTDNTKGLAVALSASRSLFDGGRLDSKIASARFAAEASKMDLIKSVNSRAYELCQIWLELNKYKTLQTQIQKRLRILDPLIDQLEEVAEAGIGDVSKVTAAQRTVAAIRVEQTNVAEGLAQAKVKFSNAFGSVSSDIFFDYNLISELVPATIDSDLVYRSPALLSEYASYQARVEKVNALRAKDSFDVGFEAKAMLPFAGSEYSSDESVGLVGRKDLFNGGLLESEISEAEALVEVSVASIRAIHRDDSRSLETAKQNIDSMKKATLVARENAKLTTDEITYLRQQLVIGGSTLDNVLSAEARLFEAESMEIQFSTDKQKSELLILSTLGLLSASLGY